MSCLKKQILQKHRQLAVYVLLAAFSAPPVFGGLQVTFLTDPPQSKANEYATAISGDGRVIVGERYGPPDYVVRPFFWSKETGFLTLAKSGRATSVSADGKSVLGYINGPKSRVIPVRWSVNGRKVTESLISANSFPPDQDLRMRRFMIYPSSADLSVLGWNSFRPSQAWLTTDNSLSKLGPYAGNVASSIHAISLNGMHSAGVTGAVSTDWGDIPVQGSIFVASRLGNVFTIPPLPGDRFSAPAGLSADASVVVGTSANADGMRTAFRWSTSGGSVAFEKVMSSLFSKSYATATGVSADGNFVVGYEILSSEPIFLQPEADTDGFVWSPEMGTKSLTDLLRENGIDLSFLHGSFVPVAVSADGSTILCVVYGSYWGDDFEYRSFIVRGFPIRGDFEFESPELRILGSKNIETFASVETLRGVATDPHLSRLEYRVARGPWKELPVRSSWQVRVRGLRTGPNKVFIRARDETGNSVTQTAVITRKALP